MQQCCKCFWMASYVSELYMYNYYLSMYCYTILWCLSESRSKNISSSNMLFKRLVDVPIWIYMFRCKFLGFYIFSVIFECHVMCTQVGKETIFMFIFKTNALFADFHLKHTQSMGWLYIVQRPNTNKTFPGRACTAREKTQLNRIKNVCCRLV
jgi:hypothetical protein